MKSSLLSCLALCLALSTSAAFARGGMESHMSSGGVFGTSAAAPGTTSSGTALSSSGVSGYPMRGPPLGTNPAIDKEDARVQKMLEGSICRGC
jgi:hypothetical protein